MTEKELDKYLTHHFVLRPEQLTRDSEIKEAALLFAQVVQDNTSPGRDQDMALQTIQMAVVAAGLALAAEAIE